MNQNHSNSAKCLIAGLIAGLVSVASAQTTWTGSVNANLNNAGNWDNGLPTSVGNPGTIGSGAGAITNPASTNGYFVTQNGGNVSSSNWVLSGGNWTLNTGGTISGTGTVGIQGNLDGHQEFNMNGGTLNRSTFTVVTHAGAGRTATMNIAGGAFTSSSQLVQNAGSTVNISGGTVDIGSNIRLNGGALNISGGTINVAGTLGRGGITTFTGGTTTANRLSFIAGTQMVMGAGSAGSVTVTTGFADAAAARDIDWLTGSQMSLSIAVANWAETEWAAGRMFYNGDNSTTLGNWATVSASIFDWDDTTNTLSLIPVPEPSAFALLAGLLGFTWVMLRRR